jgi:hypothetical protein
VKQRGRRGCCLNTTTPLERPDPAIYSQLQQLASGQQPTWNNPDITTNNFGPFSLMTEAAVTVHNISAVASAIGIRVDAAVSRFGIGYPSTSITGAIISLPPSAQQQVTIPFPQSVLGGESRIGFHILLHHPNDISSLNNSGSQVVDGFYTSESGTTFDVSFPVRNPIGVSQTISVQLISGLPDLMPALSMDTSQFGPFEERLANVHCQINSALLGGVVVQTREVTFAGWDQDGSLIGGLTFVVLIDS